MSEKKSTSKSAGSTKQWRQLGGGKRSEGEKSELQDSQPSKRLDSEESESQAIQASEHSTIEDAKHLDSQPLSYQATQESSSQTIQPLASQSEGASSMQDLTTVERSDAQKSRGKQRDKLTVYLEPDLNDWIRQQVIIEKRRRGHHVEISDIINEALQKMRDTQ